MVQLRRTLFSLTLGLFVAACGGSDSPTDPADGGDGGDGGSADTRTIKANPSFANDVVEIFMRRTCTSAGCHGGGAGGLTLTSSAATSFANLVGVTSGNSGEVYVIANDAVNSYLVKKLEGTQGSGNGNRMPSGGAVLDNIDITNIKNWINTGAGNN
jgi:hypothetical protein